VPVPVEGQAAVHLEVRQLAELLSLVEAGSAVRRGEVH
jgi:transposase